MFCCMYVCMCTACMLGAWRCLKRALNFLEAELQMAVNTM